MTSKGHPRVMSVKEKFLHTTEGNTGIIKI